MPIILPNPHAAEAGAAHELCLRQALLQGQYAVRQCTGTMQVFENAS